MGIDINSAKTYDIQTSGNIPIVLVNTAASKIGKATCLAIVSHIL